MKILLILNVIVTELMDFMVGMEVKLILVKFVIVEKIEEIVKKLKKEKIKFHFNDLIKT